MVLLLVALVVLPLFWLAVTSVQDDAKTVTLAHYRQLVVDPAFVHEDGGGVEKRLLS